jgi:hypothetical protein
VQQEPISIPETLICGGGWIVKRLAFEDRNEATSIPSAKV